jgi:hypothetical protein
MDGSQSRKRHLEGASLAKSSIHDSITPIESTIACKFCSVLIKTKDVSNPNKVMAGHLRYCLANTKRARVDGHFIENNTDQLNQNPLDFNVDCIKEPEFSIVSPINLFQSKMIEMYFDGSKIPFTTRNRSGADQSVCWETYVLINSFISEAQLSESKGDQFLNMLKHLFKIHKSNVVGLPNNYRTILTACNKKVDSLFEIITWKKCLPAEYFGTISTRGDHLRPMQGAFYPILQKLNEILLVSSPHHFASKFEKLQRDATTRVFGDFKSAECFKMLDHKIKELHGQSAVPLCFAISLDETTMNTTRSRSETPVTIMIYNLSGDVDRTSFKCEILGYAPTEFQENVTELLETLRRKGVKTAKQRKKILQCTRIQMLSDFLFDMLEPILSVQHSGFDAYVGHGVDRRIYRMFPFLCGFIGDNKGLEQLVGISCQKRFSKCRMCTSRLCTVIPLHEHAIRQELRTYLGRDQFIAGQIRGDELHENIGQRCAAIQLKYSTTAQVRRNMLDEEEQQSLAKAEELNLLPFNNRLYSLFTLTREWKMFGLHRVLPPDMLHTFKKGFVEYALTNMMVAVSNVSNLDNTHYGSNLATLDGLIMTFKCNQTLPACRMCKFSSGISIFFPSHRFQGNGNTGILTGGLASWKLLSLLVQSVMSIDLTTAILPNNANWTTSITQRNRVIKFSKQWKIREIVMKALYSTLEVYFAMAKKQMSLQELTNMVYLTNLCATHLTVLMAMNFELSCAVANIDFTTKKTPHYQGIKMHMMSHFPSAKIFWGAPSYLTDMELPELSHLRTKGMLYIELNR